MTDTTLKHYRLDAPAVVSFSGGRTSGYMLWHIIQAYGGNLPHDIKVVFCNTGKERPETLDFVERCSQQWGVEIVWLEYRYFGKEERTRKNGKQHSFEIVNYETASRNGEPFMQVIQARNMLPNIMARFCTVECKIRTTQRYLKSIGWTQWGNAIGMRADEPHRVAKLNTTNRHDNEEPVCPLYRAGINKDDVIGWWKRQPFDLQLMQHEGNCDLCFLKGAGKIRAIMRDKPELAKWWIEAEAVKKGIARNPRIAFFRADRPRYSVQLELAQRPTLLDELEADELSIACHCTD